MNMNITSGLERADEKLYSYLFNYNGRWYTDKQLVSKTKKVWTEVKTNATKYRILNNRERWEEIPFEVQCDAVAAYKNYLITTNGVVLSQLFEPIKVSKLTVRLTIDKDRSIYYVGDLMYHAFIDPTYDPNRRMTWITEDFYRATRDNLVKLEDIELKREEEEHSTLSNDKPSFSSKKDSDLPLPINFRATNSMYKNEIITPEELREKGPRNMVVIKRS